ncbi:tRNA (adenosine(37)-N6)-threonylcarbamoyltransferase complex ATPase subunit type 1 TsaE, partial [Xanthomonas perforans]|nr:tRNA (adenosine(37)-N6)-threonylcarbamoyltransferase complex ATPase subunit type 1 TsaE [Xanthomonas perforans]
HAWMERLSKQPQLQALFASSREE